MQPSGRKGRLLPELGQAVSHALAASDLRRKAVHSFTARCRQAAAGFSLLASTGALKKILPTETSHMLKSHTEDLTNLQHAMLPNIARTDHQPTQPFVSSNPFYQACARAFQCSSKCRLGIADSRFDDAQAAFEPQTLRTRRCLAYQKPPVQIPQDVSERRRTRAAPQPRFFSFTTAFSPHI